MANSASISANIAERYAQAVFDLVKEAGALDALEKQIADLAASLEASADLRELIESPVYSRDEQEAAINAVASKMGLSDTLRHTLELMAQKRRLFTLPELLTQLRQLIADERGELTADVVVAQPLSAEQEKRLAATLHDKTGKTIKLNARVDESLIGGMIVKLGSKMIDTSVRSRLASLQNAMKEVG